MFESCIDQNFSGCISVMRSGESLLRKAFGYADLPNRLENQLSTRMQTASAGKGFVAVAVMKLVESGVLKLDDRLGDWLKRDWKQIDPAVTIQQLLCHKSGVPDYFDESLMDNYAELWHDLPNYRIRCLEDLVPLFIDKPMQYPAGRKFKYNNTGFVLLSMIIEQAAGVPFDHFLQEHVFRPARMEHTGYYEMDRLPDQCAHAYISDQDANYYSNIYSVDAKGSGAGGAFTTVLDMDRFWTYLMSGQIITPTSVEEMINLYAQDRNQHYGLGFWLDPAGGHRMTPRLDGCDPGVSFVSSCDPYRSLSITIISNLGQDVWQIRQNILDELADYQPDRYLTVKKAESARLADGKTLELLTERLVIRRFQAGDWPDLYEYLSDREVVRYEPYEPMNSEQVKEEARSRADNPDFYAICLRNSGKLIGNLYLRPSDFLSWELGYVFSRQYQGQGYATESVKALLCFAFEQLKARRITAACSTKNIRSWQLLERLNMRREGCLLENIWFKRNTQGEPEWLDSYLYAILKTEWQTSEPLSSGKNNGELK